jgi:hypothetical protein
MLLVTALAYLLVACTMEEDAADADLDNVRLVTGEGGAIVGATKGPTDSVDEAALQNDDGISGEDVSAAQDKAGCTHIRWCNEPGPREVVCVTNDRPCPCREIIAECVSDANFVCGDWSHISYDPPYQCD